MTDACRLERCQGAPDFPYSRTKEVRTSAFGNRNLRQAPKGQVLPYLEGSILETPRVNQMLALRMVQAAEGRIDAGVRLDTAPVQLEDAALLLAFSLREEEICFTGNLANNRLENPAGGDTRQVALALSAAGLGAILGNFTAYAAKKIAGGQLMSVPALPGFTIASDGRRRCARLSGW